MGWWWHVVESLVRAGWIPAEMFHLGVSWNNDPFYDYSITCSADHLRRVNSNSLQNFHSLNPCDSQSSNHKDVSLPAPPYVLKLSNDFKIPLQLRIPCTHSLTIPPHLKHPSLPPPPPTHWPSTTRGGVENLPIPGIRQGNLELTAFPHSPDNTRNTKILYCPYPTSTLLRAKQPRTEWCHSSQPWGKNNILFSNNSIAPTNKIKVYAPIDSEHKLH